MLATVTLLAACGGLEEKPAGNQQTPAAPAQPTEVPKPTEAPHSPQKCQVHGSVQAHCDAWCNTQTGSRCLWCYNRQLVFSRDRRPLWAWRSVPGYFDGWRQTWQAVQWRRQSLLCIRYNKDIFPGKWPPILLRWAHLWGCHVYPKQLKRTITKNFINFTAFIDFWLCLWDNMYSVWMAGTSALLQKFKERG